MGSTSPDKSIQEQSLSLEPPIDPSALTELRELQNEDEPDLLYELVATFLDDAQPRLATLRDAVNGDDAQIIEKEAHALKGSCANFGANAMERICERLQIAGRSGDLADAFELLARLEGEFERVRQALTAELQRA